MLVGGVDVRELDPDLLWRPHRAGPPAARTCSRGTVASNLRYGKPDATDDEMWEALEVAQAADFVPAMGGLDARIDQGGTNVSGGQRQRLSIARALVRRPDVYLFDDSFSALDLATDARLRAALAPYTAGSTVLVVAQRVSTIIKRRPDPRPRGRRGGRAGHRRRAPWTAARPMRRSSPPRLGRGRRMSVDDRRSTDDRAGPRRSAAPPADRARRRGPAGWAPSACRSSAPRTSAHAAPAGPPLRAESGSRMVAVVFLGDRRRAHGARAPRLLGHATDVIVDGSPHGGPAAINFGPLHRLLLEVVGLYVGSAVFQYLAGLHAGRHGAADDAPSARRRRGQAQPRCRSATSTGPPGATCSAGSPTTSTTWPRASSRPSARCPTSSCSSGRWRLMFVISPLLAAGGR